MKRYLIMTLALIMFLLFAYCITAKAQKHSIFRLWKRADKSKPKEAVKLWQCGATVRIVNYYSIDYPVLIENGKSFGALTVDSATNVEILNAIKPEWDQSLRKTFPSIGYNDSIWKYGGPLRYEIDQLILIYLKNGSLAKLPIPIRKKIRELNTDFDPFGFELGMKKISQKPLKYKLYGTIGGSAYEIKRELVSFFNSLPTNKKVYIDVSDFKGMANGYYPYFKDLTLKNKKVYWIKPTGDGLEDLIAAGINEKHILMKDI